MSTVHNTQYIKNLPHINADIRVWRDDASMDSRIQLRMHKGAGAEMLLDDTAKMLTHTYHGVHARVNTEINSAWVNLNITIAVFCLEDINPAMIVNVIYHYTKAACRNPMLLRTYSPPVNLNTETETFKQTVTLDDNATLIPSG